MQFLTPIWFLALAAISIPVVIHLWNIRPGKTLKVGSISLITEASKSSSRSFKLLDILLLILRCLLLALLAMLLASPVWQRVVSTPGAKGWLLIPKENFKETYQKFKPSIDSLNKVGYEFHYFNTGFERNNLDKLLSDTTLKSSKTETNYWGLIKALDSKVSAAMPVYAFSPNGINHFKGPKPAVDMKLSWHTYTATDSTAKWIVSAMLTNTGSIKVTQGSSNPTGIFYTQQVLQNGGDQDLSVSTQNGLPYVSLKGGNTLAVDTNITRIAIYTDNYTVDAGYLKAALSAAVSFSAHKATIKQYATPSAIPGGQTWVFWLSEKAISGAAKSSKHLFKYEAGKPVDVNTWIEPGHIALAKTINTKSNGKAIWRDCFGQPVLRLNGNNYHFYSRFNPLWNDLVWNDEFPKMILKLIEKEDAIPSPDFDKRVLSNAQIQPHIIKENKLTASAKVTAQTDLSLYFWLVLVLLFIAERILSHKTKAISNG